MRAILLTLLLAGCMYDPGGNLDDYLIEFNRRTAQGEATEIRGYCASGCTAYLGLQKVCVAPDAVLGFHGASYHGTVEQANKDALTEWPEFKTKEDVEEYGDWHLAQAYPPKIRKMFWDVWRHKRGGLNLYHFTGKELHDMFPDEVTLCN